MKHILLIGTALCLVACSASAPDSKTETPPTDTFLQSVMKDYPATLANIAPDVWVHTTNYKLPGQAPIASNGLVVVDGDDVILVDGAWGELATVALLETIKDELGKPVTKMIITHHHPDRIAGVDAAERADIQVFTHPDTPTLAARNGYPVPNTSVASLKEPQSRTRVGAVEIAYPGPGHAADNLVVYLPESNILYGGCAVRGAETKTLGNTESADLTAWPISLNWVKATYPNTALVVPGHGKGADLSLIDGTLALLAERANATENESGDTP
ncbi:subclass B1 metallo-beta-lactamase [Litorimonas sp. RW-G-Af-16]|uniref:subclass B1 metallo-beta-lactamase n=1 Tax=Litorimonas sp. RW-G-Af-16 TaxID=3241168 RepID=UPI00390C917A